MLEYEELKKFGDEKMAENEKCKEDLQNLTIKLDNVAEMFKQNEDKLNNCLRDNSK